MELTPDQVSEPVTAFPDGNPFLIALVVDQILKNLEISDLITARLVSREWHRLSTPLVREKGPRITFSYAHDLNSILHRPWKITNGIHKPRPLFLDTMRQASTIPCQKYKITLREISDLSEYQELIDLCKPNISQFSIRINYLDCVEDFKAEAPSSSSSTDLKPNTLLINSTIRSWLRDVSTKLESLTMSHLSLHQFPPPGESNPWTDDLQFEALKSFSLLDIKSFGYMKQVFFDDFFPRTPNLEKLSFEMNDEQVEYESYFPREERFGSDGDSEEDEGGNPIQYELDDGGGFDPLGFNQDIIVGNLGKVLTSLENHGPLDKIKHLSVSTLDNQNMMRLVQLGRRGMKLKVFKVIDKLQNEDFNHLGFCQFLETQKDCLTTLVISISCSKRLNLSFPTEMEELRTLKVEVEGRLQISGVNYNTQFPKLATVWLKGSVTERGSWDLDSFFSVDDNPVPCSTIRKIGFRLPRCRRTDWDTLFHKLKIIFPEITWTELETDAERHSGGEFIRGVKASNQD